MHTTAQPPWNVAPPASAPRPILSQSRCLDVSAWLQFAGRGVLCGRDKRAGLIWTQLNKIRCPVCVRACIAGKWTRSWFQLCASGQPPEQHYLDGSCMVDGLSRSIHPARSPSLRISPRAVGEFGATRVMPVVPASARAADTVRRMDFRAVALRRQPPASFGSARVHTSLPPAHFHPASG
jgi:hypothetical protein